MATRSPTELARKRAESSRKSPQNRLLTSSKQNPTSIRFLPYPSHAVQVYFFSPGAQVTLDSLGWAKINLENSISQLGTSGWNRV